MRNLYSRIGSEDLPLFVTAVGIQAATGGNLGEILANLSSVIRARFKIRRKIRALAAEGRASAMILSALPIGMFLVIQFIAPDFYGSVWHEPLTKMLLGGASDCAWGFAASAVRNWFASSPRRFELVGGAGGLAMIGVGVTVALTGRKD